MANVKCRHKTQKEAMTCPNYRRLMDVPDLGGEGFHGADYFKPEPLSVPDAGVTPPSNISDHKLKYLFPEPAPAEQPSANYVQDVDHSLDGNPSCHVCGAVMVPAGVMIRGIFKRTHLLCMSCGTSTEPARAEQPTGQPSLGMEIISELVNEWTVYLKGLSAEEIKQAAGLVDAMLHGQGPGQPSAEEVELANRMYAMRFPSQRIHQDKWSEAVEWARVALRSYAQAGARKEKS